MGNFSPNIKIFRNGHPININTLRRPTPIIKTITISLEDAFNGKDYALEIERWILMNDVRKTEREKIYVTIPKGVDNNEIILVKGKGNIISDDNKGDIKLFIKIVNNTNFIRKGIDLFLKKK